MRQMVGPVMADSREARSTANLPDQAERLRRFQACGSRPANRLGLQCLRGTRMRIFANFTFIHLHGRKLPFHVRRHFEEYLWKETRLKLLEGPLSGRGNLIGIESRHRAA